MLKSVSFLPWELCIKVSRRSAVLALTISQKENLLVHIFHHSHIYFNTWLPFFLFQVTCHLWKQPERRMTLSLHLSLSTQLNLARVKTFLHIPDNWNKIKNFWQIMEWYVVISGFDIFNGRISTSWWLSNNLTTAFCLYFFWQLLINRTTCLHRTRPPCMARIMQPMFLSRYVAYSFFFFLACG